MTRSTWILDASHSLFEFAVKHMMIATVKGRFAKVVEGTIEADLNDLTSATFHVVVDAASVDTRDEQRDVHLRTADFFDVEQFPHVSFRSTGVTRKDGDEYALAGDLTIHGVTRPVTFDMTFEGQGKDPWGNVRIGFSAEGKINRTDFGLTFNALLETGGVLLGEQVKLSIQIEAIRQG